MGRIWLLLALGMAIFRPACAEGRVIRIPTRDGITTSLYWDPVPGAKATMLLFPGGGGGFGRIVAGRPSSPNFLVRSESGFSAQGFNVAIFGLPSDSRELDNATRVGEAHLSDVSQAVEFVKSLADAPIWLVGTSRGTVSASAAAIRLRGAIAGLVLTSSIVQARNPGALIHQDLSAIEVPVLLLHHARDACGACDPSGVAAVVDGLSHAPVRKLVMVDGGSNPSGDPCGALHWHGYIGMEAEVVSVIAGWIRDAGK